MTPFHPKFPVRTILSAAAFLALSGCMGSGTATSLATARAGLANAQAGPEIIEEDLSRSCSELTSMASALYARHEEIVRQANASQARSNILGGIASAGIGIIGGNALVNAGSIDAMRGVQAATALSQTAADAAIMNANPTSLQDITNVTTIANRAAQIERAKLQKGC